MSRLDSAIRRLEAQRACLDHGVELISGVPGPVLELGLGNGRTYDHLRSRLPEREIFVFDRQVAAHPDCIPSADRLLLGDLRQTLPAARQRFAGRAALVHADIGSGDREASEELARQLAPTVAELLAPGGVLVADQPFSASGLKPLPLPATVEQGRYFLYRAERLRHPV